MLRRLVHEWFDYFYIASGRKRLEVKITITVGAKSADAHTAVRFMLLRVSQSRPILTVTARFLSTCFRLLTICTGPYCEIPSVFIPVLKHFMAERNIDPFASVAAGTPTPRTNLGRSTEIT